MYAIVDIETTGGSYKLERITEIAIYIFDGEKIVDEFITLINPEKNIPYFITQLTGISNEMVADSPRFYEVAKQIVEITEDKIFVAHNAAFDYNFIKNEFKNLGFDFKRETLCTVKLSRKIFPGYKSYSLGEICKSLNVGIEKRHRASGDALATVKLFDLILKTNKEKGNIVPIKKDKYSLPDGSHPDLSVESIRSLPEQTGVYYLLNEQHEIIYVGKSKNIRERVFSHLRNKASRRSYEMAASVVSVDCEKTGNELIALLLESEEIKRHKPIYNRSQRRTGFAFGIFTYEDQNGYIRISIDKNNSSGQAITTFHTHDEAREFLERMIDKYYLCQKLCGLYDSDGPCFYKQVNKCSGACVGEEPAEIYNSRVNELVNYCNLGSDSFLIIGEGRGDEEFSVIKVIRGAYGGFAYYDNSSQVNDWNDILEYIPNRPDNWDVRMIIKNYLLKFPRTKTVRLKNSV